MWRSNTTDDIKIVEYRSKYRRHFRDLNYEWLERYFTVEPYDRIVLNDPEKEIIERGGVILFALVGKEVAGTCALIKHTPLKYELAKMAVTDRFQGQHLGRRLSEAAIERARGLGAETLVLATSPLLEAANHLYRAVGFIPGKPDEFGPMPYARHSIVMTMNLAASQG